MRVVVWVDEQTWPAAVDAAAGLAPPTAELVLLHVAPDDVPDLVGGAQAGLFGRGRRGRAPAATATATAATAAAALLADAAERLGRPAERRSLHGRVERTVVAALDDADLLVVARDGDDGRLGPRSLGPHTRFVVDHAPCAVLLVWAGRVPGLASIPPPPPGGPPPP